MPLQKARGFGHIVQHGAYHQIMGMRHHVRHTTSAAATGSGAHTGPFPGDCSAIAGGGLRVAVTAGHGSDGKPRRGDPMPYDAPVSLSSACRHWFHLMSYAHEHNISGP